MACCARADDGAAPEHAVMASTRRRPPSFRGAITRGQELPENIAEGVIDVRRLLGVTDHDAHVGPVEASQCPALGALLVHVEMVARTCVRVAFSSVPADAFFIGNRHRITAVPCTKLDTVDVDLLAASTAREP
jgi:hypothetical protein